MTGVRKNNLLKSTTGYQKSQFYDRDSLLYTATSNRTIIAPVTGMYMRKLQPLIQSTISRFSRRSATLSYRERQVFPPSDQPGHELGPLQFAPNVKTPNVKVVNTAILLLFPKFGMYQALTSKVATV